MLRLKIRSHHQADKIKKYQYVDRIMLFYTINTYSRDSILTNIMRVLQAENKLIIKKKLHFFPQSCDNIDKIKSYRFKIVKLQIVNYYLELEVWVLFCIIVYYSWYIHSI